MRINRGPPYIHIAYIHNIIESFSRLMTFLAYHTKKNVYIGFVEFEFFLKEHESSNWSTKEADKDQEIKLLLKGFSFDSTKIQQSFHEN